MKQFKNILTLEHFKIIKSQPNISLIYNLNDDRQNYSFCRLKVIGWKVWTLLVCTNQSRFYKVFKPTNGGCLIICFSRYYPIALFIFMRKRQHSTITTIIIVCKIGKILKIIRKTICRLEQAFKCIYVPIQIY